MTNDDIRMGPYERAYALHVLRVIISMLIVRRLQTQGLQTQDAARCRDGQTEEGPRGPQQGFGAEAQDPRRRLPSARGPTDRRHPGRGRGARGGRLRAAGVRVVPAGLGAGAHGTAGMRRGAAGARRSETGEPGAGDGTRGGRRRRTGPDDRRGQ